ncbi:hypothetical protein FJN14_10135 [Alteromonas mediterranea]|uniref:hypothetical protein n=1 Tax=Alteromonas mediterranea TaxID=314275 RepID=UPI00112FF602|nr:hypothetical protein [Alteromonas mediterranea]QDG38786.1 hypothetical protein FJN14_10135 [Alteromonas mediterranea]
MISVLKKLVPAVAVLTLASCGSTPKTSSHQSENIHSGSTYKYVESGADTKLFALLVEVKDGYEFKRFTTMKPNESLNEPWVNLDTGAPLWDISDRDGCAMDNLGIDKSSCDIDEKLFITTQRNLSGAVVGAVLSMGLISAVDVKFDKDLYIASYQNALSKLIYKGKSGVDALNELPNMIMLSREFNFSTSQLKLYQEVAKSNDFELTSLPSSLNSDVSSFPSFSSLLESIRQMTEYSSSSASNLKTVHRELNENLVEKILLMTEGELFDWIDKDDHKNFVSQKTQNIAANRSNELALKTISKFKSYQEAEQWIQFRSRAKHFEPRTVDAAKKQFVDLLNESYQSKAKNAQLLVDYKYIINVYGPHKDKLHTKKYLEIANKKIAEYKKEQQVLAQKSAEQRRLYDQQQRQKFIANIKSYRNSLSEGQDSHCGLIVEVKDKIVRVETMVGLKFFKKDQMYPAGVANCRFLNNVYQPPRGMGV